MSSTYIPTFSFLFTNPLIIFSHTLAHIPIYNINISFHNRTHSHTYTHLSQQIYSNSIFYCFLNCRLQTHIFSHYGLGPPYTFILSSSRSPDDFRQYSFVKFKNIFTMKLFKGESNGTFTNQDLSFLFKEIVVGQPVGFKNVKPFVLNSVIFFCFKSISKGFNIIFCNNFL